MSMIKSKLTFISNAIILLLFLYIILFINYHLYISKIGELDIVASQSADYPKTTTIPLSPINKLKKYYLLIYKDSDLR